jgi:Tol biopolymer transport system component
MTSFEAGRRLGSFEILGPLGAGSMGEVYRARDTRLGREVALKTLPAAVSADPARLARFEREARMLASLSHPNIAAIFGLEGGLEEAGSVVFLVLELVEGETLADRLEAGPLPSRQALLYCRQIAEALEAAHAKGIVHRDLKPSNVRVTPDGRVKVLDFGLAKALADESSGEDISDSSTLATREGVILGTAAYMSPEQARGRQVGRQTDVWAFGCILFECLTGQRPFGGATMTDTLVTVLAGDPDFARLPSSTHPLVRSLLGRCLEKDTDRRLHDIADARLEIEESLQSSGVNLRRDTGSWRGLRRQRWLRRAAWGLAMVGLGAAGAWLILRLWPRTPAAARSLRLDIAVPAGVRLAEVDAGQPAFALAPDGGSVAFVGEAGGRRRIYVRALADLEARPVAGTEGGAHPFFSPDGEWIGFVSEGKLRKVNLRGGEPLVLADAPRLRGASWGADETIVFAPTADGGLMSLHASGGPTQALTTPGNATTHRSHRWPQILPRSQGVLFGTATTSGREEDRGVAVLRRDTGEWRELLTDASYPRYVPGHLLFARAGSLLAVPFDLESLEVKGAPVSVLQDLRMSRRGSAVAFFEMSSRGDLLYVPGYPRPPDRRLVWVDRKGTVLPLTAPRRPYFRPVLSPDGRRLAVVVEGSNDDVWVHDLERESWTRLTFEADNTDPVWASDGARMFFASNRGGAYNLFAVPADGSGVSQLLLKTENWALPGSISPEGRRLAFAQLEATSSWDVWALELDSRTATPFLQTAFVESFAAFDPSGRFLAYVSTESGRPEVYVRPFPGPGAKWPISSGGGTEPVWSRDGRELFYRQGSRLMVVAVGAGSTLSVGSSQLLFEGRFEPGINGFPDYDVAPDGRRFIMVEDPDAAPPPARLVIAPGWLTELDARMGKRP